MSKPPLSNKKLVLISCVGNAMEYYDFALYAVFAMKMAEVFFPSDNQFVSLIASLSALAVGFFTRPIGALLFGSLGDKYGRRTALTISIIGIGFPTVTIGLTPSYAEIGILAPIIVVSSRVVQGLCTAGEYNGAGIFCLEHIGQNRPGYHSAYLASASATGALSATLIGGYFVTLETDGAWRIPFILGFFIAFVGLWLRHKIEDSWEFKNRSGSAPHIPLRALITEYKLSCTKTFSVGYLNGILSYTTFGFLSIYLSLYGSLPPEVNVVYINMVGLIFLIIGNPIMGNMYDVWGEKKYVTIMFPAIAFSFLVGFILLMQPSLSLVIIGQAVFGLGAAAIGGPTHVMVHELFPTLIRYRGVAFSFNVGIAIGGGTISIVHLALIQATNIPYMPSLYISLVLLAAYFIFKASAVQSRREENYAKAVFEN